MSKRKIMSKKRYVYTTKNGPIRLNKRLIRPKNAFIHKIFEHKLPLISHKSLLMNNLREFTFNKNNVNSPSFMLY